MYFTTAEYQLAYIRAQIVGTLQLCGQLRWVGILGRTMLLDCIARLDSRPISQLEKQVCFHDKAVEHESVKMAWCKGRVPAAPQAHGGDKGHL